MSEKKGMFGGLFGRKKKGEAEPGDETPHEETIADGSDEASPDNLDETASETDPQQKDATETDNKAIADAVASPVEGPVIADAEPEPDSDPAPEPEKKKAGFFSRLKQGLTKTSDRLTSGVTDIFTKGKLDDEKLEELEDLLISADLGLPAATRITTALAKGRYDKQISDEDVRAVLAEEVAKTLKPLEAPLTPDPANRPHIILMAGVNGAGKTTTIGKLAQKFKADGKSVMLAAGDTFRAAAIEQLQAWGERVGAPVIASAVGADAAGLAYDAIEKARAENIDVLMIDTAGRLQNRKELMDELAKVVRVIRKLDETAPHDALLVLDATVGQNALSQAEIFKEVAGISGLVMTKLDGTARGGVLVALADAHGLPIHFIGVGETADDLQIFDADGFGRALAGVDALQPT